MPNFRRYYEPGGTYFFTLITARRERIFDVELGRYLLGDVLRAEQMTRPFEIVAIVLLPDHMHTVWRLPSGDANYSLRMSSLKAAFTRKWLAAQKRESAIRKGQLREGRRGVWQPRFYEHLIGDEDDLERHVDYIHYNPVKHGLASSPREWPWSTFERFIAAGQYSADWGCQREPTTVATLEPGLLE